MATPQENATAARDHALARLAELDAMTVEEKVRTTYTGAGGKTISWNEYRAGVQAVVDAYTSREKAIIQQVGGPFQIVSVERG